MKRLIIYIIFLIGFLYQGYAQVGAKQEVKVVKPYEPVISDAFKIGELPKINDTLKIVPSFSYDITPVKYETSFLPKPIKPARLINEPLSKLYYGYAKVGFGSYLSPLAEVSVGSKRSKLWQWNSMVHYSSLNGKVKNDVGEKVYAGLSNFSTGANAKRFFENSTVIEVNARYTNTSSYFYGYNPDVISSIIEAPLLKEDIEKQTLNSFKIGANYASNHIDSAHINYNINLDWRTSNTIDNYGENELLVGTNIDYFFEKEFIGVDASVRAISNDGFQDTVNYGLVNFSPWVGAFGKKWRVLVGVNTFFKTDSSTYNLYPRVSLHYNIIDFFLIPYIEYSGNLKVNTFASLYNENHFIKNDLTVKPTNNKYNITVGFRGNISSKIAFNMKVDFAGYTDHYFYVNDTTIDLQNKFDVVYDDMTRVRFLGEISYKSSSKLFLSVKGNYYSYSLDKEKYAWHMPDYELSFNAKYIIQDKIIADLNLFSIGKRYAREFDINNQEKAVELQGVIDLNIGLEYRYSKKLSAFVKLNNIAAMKYYKWNNYPTQQFNIMLGLTYSF